MMDYDDSNQNVSRRSSFLWYLIGKILPPFRFMIHDKWEDVLFLHWKVPPGSELESMLEADAAPFLLEKFNGSAWIGLILLTERNVGPSVLRSKYTCVTHHGINVRTYVTGGVSAVNINDTTSTSSASNIRGIHFTSLECNDAFTAFGANFFGMPYKVSNMERSHDDCNAMTETMEKNSSISTPKHRWERQEVYKIRSERMMMAPSSLSSSFARRMFGSVLNLCLWPIRFVLCSTANNIRNSRGRKCTGSNNYCDTTKNEVGEGESSSLMVSSRQQPFAVDCSWRLSGTATLAESSPTAATSSPTEKVEELESFDEWAAERYFVYTRKYGLNWRGQVDHEPWPLVLAEHEQKGNGDSSTVCVQLEHLDIAGIDAYEPKSARPILRYLADHKPDRVAFSRGVGPVHFTMLQPV